MNVRRTRWTAPLLFAAWAMAACGAARPGADAEPAPDDRTIAEIEALFQARADSARMRYTDADVHFMTGMIGHHAQALVMAGLAPTNGASPRVRTLAARIINAQRDEIASMQRWLRDRGQPVPEVHIDGTEMVIHGADHATEMPGMLSPEQMRDLVGARGEEFDRFFLLYMIQHHRGAVIMVADLFATDGAAQDDQVFKFASDVQADQSTEIERMERMLSDLSGERPDA